MKSKHVFLFLILLVMGNYSCKKDKNLFQSDDDVINEAKTLLPLNTEITTREEIGEYFSLKNEKSKFV